MLSKDRDPLAARLRSAEGHLRSVARMVEEGRDPEQILHQLDAVQGAVRRVQREILLCCVSEGLEKIKTETCPEKIALRVDRIYRLYQTHA